MAQRPGIGLRQSHRLAYFLLQADPEFKKHIIQELSSIDETVIQCDTCRRFFEPGSVGKTATCLICKDPAVTPEVLMIVEKSIIIKNKQGLHARPAALFVQIANKFDSDIAVSKGKLKVNGKSIMGIMMLEAGKGAKVTLTIKGEDAEQAMAELENLLLSDIEDIAM